MASIYVFKPTNVETSSGDWTEDTEKVIGGICKQVYVKADSSDTTFDFIITDDDDVEQRKFESCTGVLNDLTEFPMRGVYTATLDNASADEAFTVRLYVLE